MAHYHGVGGNLSVVEYIESTGTQYIDTGFKPNQNTRVVCDIHQLDICTDWSCIFGARDTPQNKNVFGVWVSNNNQFAFYRGTAGQNALFASTVVSTDRQTIDANKNATTIGGVTASVQQTTFQSSYSICLCAANTGGEMIQFSKTRIYSCQIYDNGTLVRDYIPCVYPDGLTGLFDKVNNRFYGNAGAGVFTVGPETGETINYSGGIARQIIKRYHEVDVVYRKIKKAYHEVDGVARLYFRHGTPIIDSGLSVGDSVYINVDGVSTEFLIVNIGNPDSSKYDESCNGIWLLAKDIFKKGRWNDASMSSKTFFKSSIKTYLNEDFIDMLADDIKSIVKEVTVPDYDAIPVKVFLPSLHELGVEVSYRYSSYGSPLQFFDGKDRSYRTATYNGSSLLWWTRDTVINSYFPNGIACIDKRGDDSEETLTDSSIGVRPMFILQLNALVDNNYNVVV